MLCVCLCLCVRVPMNHLTDFHEIWYERCFTGGEPYLMLCNFLHPLINTGGQHWRHFFGTSTDILA